MKGKYSYLSKNILLFALSGVVPKLLAFFLIPIYTGYLSTAEYGTADLINTTVELLLPICTLTIHDAVLRFGMNKDYSAKEVLSNGLFVAFLGTIIVVIGCFLVSYFKLLEISNTYLFFLILLFFINGMNNIVTRFCRTIDKVQVITIGGIANSIATFSLNILFLVVFKWGINGYLATMCIGHGASLLICFFGARLYRYLTLKLSKKTLKKMIAFSFPMIFSALAWWINNASDKYILNWFCGVSVSGIFAISNKIPSLLAAIQTIFLSAWSISAIKDFDKNDSDGFIGNIYTVFQLLMLVASSGLMIVNYPLAEFLYAKEFFVAWQYVPPLLMANYFNAMSLYMDGLFMAVNDTKLISISTLFGAIINTICNFILIYFFGAYGAAIATMIGFGAGFLFRLVAFKKYVKIKVNRKREIFCVLLIGIQMGSSFLKWASLFIQIPIVFFILFLYRKELKNLLISIKSRSGNSRDKEENQ